MSSVEQISSLASSPNIALVLSLCANVVMGLTIKWLFGKLQESVSAKDQLANKIVADYLEEKKCDQKNP